MLPHEEGTIWGTPVFLAEAVKNYKSAKQRVVEESVIEGCFKRETGQDGTDNGPDGFGVLILFLALSQPCM